MACACTRPRPAIPIRNAFTGSLSLPSGPRRLPSGSPRAAWTRPRARQPRLFPAACALSVPARLAPSGECVEGKTADRHHHAVLPCSNHTAEPDQVAAAVLIPVPICLGSPTSDPSSPHSPSVRVRTGEAAVGAGGGRSALEPDGVSERDRVHLAVRPHGHGGVLLPDRSADSLQEGTLAVAAASEPDSLQMMLSRGVRVAPYLIAVAAPSNPSS